MGNIGNQHTMFLIVEEHFFHAQGRCLIIKEDVSLKVILKGTEVDIITAASTQ